MCVIVTSLLNFLLSDEHFRARAVEVYFFTKLPIVR